MQRDTKKAPTEYNPRVVVHPNSKIMLSKPSGSNTKAVLNEKGKTSKYELLKNHFKTVLDKINSTPPSQIENMCIIFRHRCA